MRRALPVCAALVLTLTAGGCSVVGGGGTYTLTADFAKSPSLYEGSRVKVMGANVGTIDKIEVDKATGGVRVQVSVRSDVPVPADARAAILATNTIGERNIVLYPAWKPGMPEIADGAVIPRERTDLPVEIDEALEAFSTLAESVDPGTLHDAFEGGADLVRGKGDAINNGLQTVGDLTGDIAAQDDRLMSVASDLNDLAASLNRRDEKLKALFTAFNDAGGLLADERDTLRGFIGGLEAVIERGDVLIEAYHEKLPQTVADASEIVMSMKASTGSLADAIAKLAEFTDMVVRSYDPKRKMIIVRLQMSGIARTWLQPLWTAMGWGAVPCLDKPLGNCPKTIDKTADGPKSQKPKKPKTKKAGGS
ncbi:virulence factor Mce-like protein [Actinocorallia herbida]|uniref:Virulence factor Mce-like protein n=1 Tax=Actinocorallia herbida TaxID=58109 RepID=A0A3N1D3W9_9ACTN|nr:MCE family protein [Actinocorallia herbida]ROO88233.1 virulence factor Mce-like protein [Actinocorallia herbida]